MKIMYLCITRSYHRLDDFKRETIYECTRKYWKLKEMELPKANGTDFIVGVADRQIKGVYKNLSGWKMVRDRPELQDETEVKDHPEYQDRWAFDGEEVTSSEIIGEIKKDYANHPFRFNVSYVIHYNF
ncbi:MAG: hypothetical protein IIT58_07230 [Treponema sp.]|nr:hypothetical protein [Treponema sp.]